MYREIVTLSSKYNCQSVLYGDEVAVGGTIAFSYKLKQKLFTEGFLALSLVNSIQFHQHLKTFKGQFRGLVKYLVYICVLWIMNS